MVLREVIAAISRAKDEMTDARRYRKLAEEMARKISGDDCAAAEKCLEIARMYDLYEQALKDNRAVDFGDLIMRPTLLLESNESLRAAIGLRHRHVLVDEYQDVNRASARLLKAIAGDGKRLWVVGDARQSIYRFRGASSSNMDLFASEYPDAKPTSSISITAPPIKSSMYWLRSRRACTEHRGCFDSLSNQTGA